MLQYALSLLGNPRPWSVPWVWRAGLHERQEFLRRRSLAFGPLAVSSSIHNHIELKYIFSTLAVVRGLGMLWYYVGPEFVDSERRAVATFIYS